MGVIGQYSTSTGSGGAAATAVIYVILFVIYVASLWRVFTKAGQSGWKAIIPIYDLYIVLKIVGRPGWWLLLYLIPIVNLVIGIIVLVDLSHSFGKSGAFAIGLLFLSIIFYPILGFGSARYFGPAAGRGRLTESSSYQPAPPFSTGDPPVPPPPPA